MGKIRPKIKREKITVYKSYCPKCNKQLSGDGKYICKCGTWRFDHEIPDFVLEEK